MISDMHPYVFFHKHKHTYMQGVALNCVADTGTAQRLSSKPMFKQGNSLILSKWDEAKVALRNPQEAKTNLGVMLPNFMHPTNLPYIVAHMLLILQWSPVCPGGPGIPELSSSKGLISCQSPV